MLKAYRSQPVGAGVVDQNVDSPIEFECLLLHS